MTQPQSAAGRPVLQYVIAAGYMRYLLIASWALALGTVTGWREAVAWFCAATSIGIVRTFVERRLVLSDRRLHDRIKLTIATVSCIAWAAAPLLAFVHGGAYGVPLGVGLLMAGYVLVFTQMRAAPREAVIVSAPYSIVTVLLLISLWGDPGFWVMLGMVPVLGLALFIKVVITQMKDGDLEAVNRRQAELIAELEIARDRADAASAAKSNFLGVISHELRTPMNGVLGAAQLLQMSELSDRQKEFVGVIRNSGEGLMVLLNDILDITKIESGKMELDIDDIETDTLMARLTGPFKAQAEARGLTFATEIRGDLPPLLKMDPLRLAQVAHNLLANAIKFTPQGEVRLVVESEPRTDGRIALGISVVDSGIGIAADDLSRLFQPFSQVDGSSTRKFGGTGLGLSICQRLAVLMDGEITVASIPGQGSTFTLHATFDTPLMQDARIAA
ncbi:MAG: ATP-binding protein [Brevundimonas sp.]|uniref:sensor histidine kinase n=1 Tax=Brevundimonas sp. TaxID=1871086 RepID=UPI0027199CAB|nr:ATP-binding protein [Brevundimonas sp.]MDO9609294.1 ATP-binding protein [Brevundimonas sp.]